MSMWDFFRFHLHAVTWLGETCWVKDQAPVVQGTADQGVLLGHHRQTPLFIYF